MWRVEASSSSLNMQLSPYGNGSSTMFSWNFTGDIVSSSGHAVSFSGDAALTHPFNEISSFGITSSGIFSEAFAQTFNFFGHSYDSFSNSDPGFVYYNYVRFPNPVVQTDYATLDTTEFSNLFSLFSPGPLQDSISLIFTTLQVPQYAPYNFIHYSPGRDSTVIPLSFSSFNVGTYSSADNSQVDGITTILTVAPEAIVPEPSAISFVVMGVVSLSISLVRIRNRSGFGTS